MTTQLALQILHLLAGIVVLYEALNKVARTDPLASGLTAHQRTIDCLKFLAWWLLAIGAGGALAGPFLQPGAEYVGMGHLITHITQPAPSLADVCVLSGFAVLIVRTRIKEG